MDKDPIAINYFIEHQAEFMGKYFDILRIPSVSTEAAHKPDMVRTAEFLANYFRELGMDRVEIFPTNVHPILFAEKRSKRPNAKTLLVYGHYDVQPPDPCTSGIPRHLNQPRSTTTFMPAALQT